MFAERNQPERRPSVTTVPAHTSGPFADLVTTGQGRFPASLGISLRNKMSNRKHLEILIPWVVEHSSEAIVIIGDYIDRFNHAALSSLPFGLAASKALKQGKRPTSHALQIVQSLGVCPRNGLDR